MLNLVFSFQIVLIDPFYSNWVNFMKSNEHSEYSFIDLADFLLFFFQEKVFKFVHAVLIVRGLTCDFLLSSVHLLC